MRSIVVLAYDTWETASHNSYVMEITEGEYEDLIADEADPADFPDSNMVSLIELIKCWNTHNHNRKLPLSE